MICIKNIFDRRRKSFKDCHGLRIMMTSGTRERMESGTTSMMTSSRRVSGIKKSQRRRVILNQTFQRFRNLHLNLHQSLNLYLLYLPLRQPQNNKNLLSNHHSQSQLKKLNRSSRSLHNSNRLSLRNSNLLNNQDWEA